MTSRNLLEGWCERGPSVAESARGVTPPATRWWESDAFLSWDGDDRRAALYAWLLTGRTPQRRDSPGAGDARVDLVLDGDGQGLELIEILSTIDGSYQQDIDRARRLVADLNADVPRFTVAVRLNRGWTAPLTRNDRAAGRSWDAAKAAARVDSAEGVLRPETLDLLQEAWPSASFSVVTDAGYGPGYYLSSWNARVLDSGSVPYLARLSDYLSSDHQAVRHVMKLEREAAALGATRLHLYLLLSSTGELGDLLPSSPSYLTEGTFQPPEGLTDIWLDGGTGYIYRWTVERGWSYHEN